jgi:hypothetical protein
MLHPFIKYKLHGLSSRDQSYRHHRQFVHVRVERFVVAHSFEAELERLTESSLSVSKA